MYCLISLVAIIKNYQAEGSAGIYSRWRWNGSCLKMGTSCFLLGNIMQDSKSYTLDLLITEWKKKRIIPDYRGLENLSASSKDNTELFSIT